MAGRKRIDDLTKQRVVKAYLEGTYRTKTEAIAQLAERFTLGKSTVERILSKAGVNDLIQPIVSAQIQKTRGDRPKSPGDTDYLQTLKDCVNELSTGVVGANVKSPESAATAIAKLVELIWQREPETIDQLVDYVLEHPAFTPERFLKAVRDRLSQSA